MSNQIQEKVVARFSKKKQNSAMNSRLERFAEGVYDSFMCGFAGFNN